MKPKSHRDIYRVSKWSLLSMSRINAANSARLATENGRPQEITIIIIIIIRLSVE